MAERTLNWGPDEATAQYQTGEDQATGNFVVAEDTTGGTILLEYDEGASEWVSRGPVNMSGNDISNVGTLSATAVDTDDVKINNYVDRASLTGSNQTINSGVSTTVQLDTVDDSELGGWDLANNQWVAPSDGKYLIAASVSWADANSTGEFQVFIQINGSPAPFQGKIPLSSGESEYQFKPVSAYNLTSNDSVELVVFHNSGSNENINAAADNTTLQILNGA